MKLKQTPSQTVGPFFSKALLHEGGNDLAARGAAGQPVVITGRVLDGDGAPVSDALVEIWQANAAGRYDHPDDTRDLPTDPHFSGFGRAGTDAQGNFRFRTIKPGPVPGTDSSLQAPHIVVSVFARGLLKRLVTRLYFPDEPLNAHDPVLASVPDATRRTTLIARSTDGASTLVLRFDIVLQGDNETVFFDI
ncbi:MAG: protocatechuate 3,4-dioxygenase subunit alpha [Deltaproteobacteria bacterium]|nr:protocatechuate 3,4-dioxygenase subunit alpha [Deltaproteobacteria bacterium]